MTLRVVCMIGVGAGQLKGPTETPDGRAWYRDEERCCEHDDALRPYDPWRDNQRIHCNGCGALVFVT